MLSLHLDATINDDNGKTMVINNGILSGFVFIAFFDENKLIQGQNPIPISYTEFPLSFLEPFKPLNL